MHKYNNRTNGIFKATAVLLMLLFCCSLGVSSSLITANAATVTPVDLSGSEYASYTPLYCANDLARINEVPDGDYILMADIDMKDVDWTPINFSGNFMGNGHTIYNLTIKNLTTDTRSTVDGNNKIYATTFAGFFGIVENATISDLSLLNVRVEVKTDQNCFIAGLAGYTANTVIDGCSVDGFISLESTNWMVGTGGLVGFGDGTISHCTVNTTQVMTDVNPSIKCEQFLGGVLSCGYSDIEDCDVTLLAYDSVIGYVHNGGIVGMHHIHNKGDYGHAGYVKNNTIDAVINFFENNTDRRAYCVATIGETLNAYVKNTGNKVTNFVNGETKDYSTILKPHYCTNPEYTESVTAGSCDSFGYTTYTCKNSDYSYKDNYTAKVHNPGDWTVVKEATYTESGIKVRYCKDCNEIAEIQEIPVKIPINSFTLSADKLNVRYKGTGQLSAYIDPIEANVSVTYSSSDESIVTVDDTGKLTSHKRGTATITCTTEDGEHTATCTVKVGYTWWQWFIVIILFGWIWY
jgi:hypothetical protein